MLADPGAQAHFVSEVLVGKLNLPTTELPQHQPIVLADGKEFHNATHKTQVTVMFPSQHCERLDTLIAPIAEDIIIGLPWFAKHDPRITWSTREISITSGDKTHTWKADAPARNRALVVSAMQM